MFCSVISYFWFNKSFLLIIWIAIKGCHSLVYQEHIHEKCISKSDANDIRLNCESTQRIAIHEAFFTASVRLRCTYPLSTYTESVELLSEDIEDMNAYPRIPSPCTDDLRLSIIRKCSGAVKCEFDFSKDHSPKCIGEDGSLLIKYSCIAADKYFPFCNLNLTGSYGYVSTPGYPSYYPPYDKCVWNIEGGNGQIVQIDLLDVSVKEPRIKTTNNRKKHSYTCTDKLVLLEENTKMLTVCGQENSNLVQHRTKSNRLTIEFTSEAFSPTRGILFRYSLQNCPTIPAPKNGHLLRNGSFAYYSCCLDHVFEDTKEAERTLYCEFGSHWNSTVPKCVAKDLLISSSLTLFNDSNNFLKRAQAGESSTDSYISDILVPVILMITLLLGNAFIIWILFRLKRKHKQEVKNTESNVPLNSGSDLQTNV